MGILFALVIWVLIALVLLYLVRLLFSQFAPQFTNIAVAVLGLLMLIWVIYHLGFGYAGTGL